MVWPASAVRFQRHIDASRDSVSPDPKIAAIRNSPSNRNSALMDSMPLAVFFGKLYAQRVFCSLSRKVMPGWIINRIVPAEMQPGIVIAIIRFARPITRQPNRIRRLIETSIPDQLRSQSALHLFEHEFIELAIKQRAYLTLDLIRTDIYVGRKRISTFLRAKNRMVK